VKLSEQLKARLEELRKESKALYEQRGALIDGAVAEKRGMSDEEQASYDDLTKRRNALETQMGPLEERLTEALDQEKREAESAEIRAKIGADTPATIVKDEAVYRPNYENGHSFFRDMALVQLNRAGARDAHERLERTTRAVNAEREKRALGNTNATGGSGGEFAPPEWLVSEYIALARAGRVTANLLKHGDVPAGVSVIELPRVATGTTVAIQSTQNTALSQTDMTTNAVGTGFTTVGGKQVVSQQMLDQSAIAFDQVILNDLAAAYAQQIGSQIFIGAGTGANNNSVINGLANASVLAANQATLAASPTAATFYSKANGMYASFVANRFADPTHWIMHPRRWFWLTAQVDSQGRPLVVPASVAYNPIAQNDTAPMVQGFVGTFLGLPVVIDPNVPTNLGAGSNQDEIFLIKADDLWLFESPVQAESFREPYADSVGVLFRLYAYAGTILNRYNSSIATMNGAGLVPPSF
jgi:HK97 family phage major capsid protein